jgi:hypothetical protein
MSFFISIEKDQQERVPIIVFGGRSGLKRGQSG